MQSLLLAKPQPAKRVLPSFSENLWVSTAREAPANVSSLDDALQALTEADRVIQTQAEHIRHLESLAMTDELTGLLNRRGFTMSLQREIALARRDEAANGVLVMADLDGFKAINDKWGHNTGDAYLQAVADALVGDVRTSDIVARLGGDEFAILFPRMDEADSAKRLATLDKNFNERCAKFGDLSLPLRASFGMSVYTGTDTVEAILANADLKLYAHKASRKKKELVTA